MKKKLFDEIPVIESDFLILRKIEEKDAAEIEAMSENPNVRKYLPTFLFEFGFADKKQAIRQMYKEPFEKKESLFLGIYLKTEPDHLTGIAEVYNYDPGWNKASVGYRISEPYWHKGIGGGTAELLIKYLFEQTDVKRVTLHIMTENTNSGAIARRLGCRLRKAAVKEDWGFETPVIVDKYILEKLGNIRYAKVGNGPKTMVILPGFTFKSALGSADLAADAYSMFKNYTVYLFDDRSNLGENYTLRERAGDIAAEMKTLGLRNACVYGVSIGALTAQYLAIDHPGLVKQLALCSTACSMSGRSLQVLSQWKTLADKGLRRELVRQTVSDIYAPETVERFGTVLEKAIGYITGKEMADFSVLVNACLSYDCTGEIGAIRCPVLLIESEGDRVFPPQNAEPVTKLPNCETALYGRDYGHAVYDEARECRNTVLEFFDECKD